MTLFIDIFDNIYNKILSEQSKIKLQKKLQNLYFP